MRDVIASLKPVRPCVQLGGMDGFHPLPEAELLSTAVKPAFITSTFATDISMKRPFLLNAGFTWARAAVRRESAVCGTAPNRTSAHRNLGQAYARGADSFRGELLAPRLQLLHLGMVPAAPYAQTGWAGGNGGLGNGRRESRWRQTGRRESRQR